MHSYLNISHCRWNEKQKYTCSDYTWHYIYIDSIGKHHLSSFTLTKIHKIQTFRQFLATFISEYIVSYRIGKELHTESFMLWVTFELIFLKVRTSTHCTGGLTTAVQQVTWHSPSKDSTECHLGPTFTCNGCRLKGPYTLALESDMSDAKAGEHHHSHTLFGKYLQFGEAYFPLKLSPEMAHPQLT